MNEPVLAIFLTDGAPDSKPQAVEELTKASYAPVFWQFLSIGSENIPFLQKLDDLDGRYIDNADYKPVGNVDTISDDELFNMILMSTRHGLLNSASAVRFANRNN